MSSIGVKLPLQRSTINGFGMNKEILSVVQQNLKMLILTIPGERTMIPNYGVGLKTFLFSTFTPSLVASIENKIREQVKIYMPAVIIKQVLVETGDIDTNTLSLKLIYSIPGLTSNDLLSITI